MHELLETEVGAEPGFRQNVVGVTEREPVPHDGGAAVRDVAERPGVYYHGLALGGLDDVGLDCISQQGHHRADGAYILGSDGSAVGGAGLVCVADDNPAQSGAQILKVSGEGKDGHNLRCRNDVEAALTDWGVVGAADAGHYGAQGAVFNVGDAPPGDALGPEAGNLTALGHVVRQGGKQVVSGADGVGVAGEVDVDLIFRLNEAESAACSAALDAEDRAQRWLSEGGNDVLAEPAHRLGQTDRCGGLALARGGGSYAGHDDHLTPPSTVADSVQAYLGLVVAVGDDRVGAESQVLCYVHDGPHTITSSGCCATGRGLAS